MAAGQLRQTRRRIRSVQSTAKITRAMELVAASKMRRSQLNALAARPYAERMGWVLADLAETLSQIDPADRHPLIRARDEIRAVDLILVTPNRGLSGALPGNLVRSAAQFVMEREGTPVRVTAVGRKGRDFMRRTGQEIIARTHFRGATKRRLHRFESAEPVSPGDKVSADDRNIGEVVNAIGRDLLAVVPVDKADASLTVGKIALTHISIDNP